MICDVFLREETSGYQGNQKTLPTMACYLLLNEVNDEVK